MSLTQVMILVEVDCSGIKTGPDRYHIDAPALNYKEMRYDTEPEGWAKIRERVIRSRAQELGRARENLLQCADVLPPHPHFPRALHRLRALSRTRITEQGLTPAPTTDILKVARTVADIEETAIIEPKHIAEAIEYRAWTGHTGRNPRQLASRAQTHPGKAK